MTNDNTTKTLGSTVQVTFPNFDIEVEGKVDTGATTSSLHATNIKINQDRGSVSFMSPSLSQNVITAPLKGTQDVVSADGGAAPRPIVTFDVIIDGTELKGVEINLNDREHMDTKLLIGQNILKAGNFSVDVNKDADAPESSTNTTDTETQLNTDVPPRSIRENATIAQAVEVLRSEKVTIEELFQYLTYEALTKVENLEP